jgi:fibronectin type III domain protein
MHLHEESTALLRSQEKTTSATGNNRPPRGKLEGEIIMAFRKQAALALALASVVMVLGCTDQLNAPSTTDEQPVLPPTNVSAFALSDGSVRVKWDASSEPTINGYNLYRREVGLGSPKRVNGTRILATQYLDEGTTSLKNYEYRVTAVNVKGRESRFVSVYVQAIQLVPGTSAKLPALGSD